jgi:hypothetical protein
MIAENASAEEIARLEIQLKGKIESLESLVKMDQDHMINYILRHETTAS